MSILLDVVSVDMERIGATHNFIITAHTAEVLTRRYSYGNEQIWRCK